MASDAGNPFGWLWGAGEAGENQDNAASRRSAFQSNQDWGLSLPQLQSLTGMDWWGKSVDEDSKAEPLPADEAVRNVFSEHVGEEMPPYLPTQDLASLQQPQSDKQIVVPRNQAPQGVLAQDYEVKS